MRTSTKRPKSRGERKTRPLEEFEVLVIGLKNDETTLQHFVKKELLYDPAILFLGIYTNN
jgi:hypothetical protein